MIAVRSWHNYYYSGKEDIFYFGLLENGTQIELTKEVYDTFAGTKICGGHDCGRTWGNDWCDLVRVHSSTPFEKIVEMYLAKRR